LRTYNVRFPGADYDETSAATAVSRHIQSRHQTLDLQDFRGTWEGIVDLLKQAGQPFADTSMFAVNAVSALMRRQVKVALSGDGGDEAFSGYSFYTQLAHVARLQSVPRPLFRLGRAFTVPLAGIGAIPAQVPRRLRLLENADDVGVVQAFRSWVRDDEHRRLVRTQNAEPVRRLFEPQWRYDLPRDACRSERLSALCTEMDTRLFLSNDMLFKVDMASMKESLEVRVPMLDEDLFAFGLALPHSLKVHARVGKSVLRRVAERRLPPAVASKGKHGFAVPVDAWVTEDFKRQLRSTLLEGKTVLPDFLEPKVYRPWIEAFCNGSSVAGITREGLYQRATMLLALHTALPS